MDLVRAKLERKNLRISFTNSANKTEEELSKASADLKKLAIFENQLKDKFVRLDECQNRITGIILQSENAEEEYEADFKTAEEYRERYLELKTQIESKLCASHIGSLESKHEKIEKRAFKLPKIELKKFNGDAKEYLMFWSQFKKIHEDNTISDSDKFQYLLQAVVPNSRAARVVESFPATAENYKNAVIQIQERFGREDLLVQVYIRDLLSMVMKNAIAGRVKTDLPKLYDELEGKLRSLESLGRTQEKYGDFLIPLVESILPEEVLITWERKRNLEEASGEERSLKNLMCFLKHEVQSEEMVVLARSGFGANTSKIQDRAIRDTQIPTASSLVSISGNPGRNNFSCLFCDKRHPSRDCIAARNMSLDSKKSSLFKKGACFSCFRIGHTSRTCKLKNVCINCGKNHHFLMCSNNVEKDPRNKEICETTALNNSCNIKNVYLMTLTVKIKTSHKEILVRAILDSGSQGCYISRDAINRLDLKTNKKVKMQHTLFGGRDTKVEEHGVYNLAIFSLDGRYSVCIEAFSERVICGTVPKISEFQVLNELKEKGIILSDYESGETEISLLLGADICGTILTGKSRKLDCGLHLLETHLGLVLTGKCEDSESESRNDNVLNVISMHVKNLSANKLWSLDAIGISDPIENQKKDLEYSKVLLEFKDTLNILPDGRYQLSLPFKTEVMELPANRELAWNRHQKMCRRAEENLILDEYKNVFREWESLNIIERVTDDRENGHFLPHRPVIKNDSTTTKIRPVFDASAKQSGKCSLNDLLYKGPNLIELIPDIIDRFRSYPIGLSADIEKAFLQLEIVPEHRDFLKFYFPDEEKKIIYRHCRVVFGVSSSPFLLAASISHLLDNVPYEFETVAEQLKLSFYVDNCVTGISNVTEQDNFIKKAKKVMSRGCFNLRSWESNMNCNSVSKSSGVTKLLGILWDLDNDTLKCSINLDNFSDKQYFTKRLVLSTIQKIFDPIGFLCPATLPPKILLQQAWKLNLSWDTPLPENILKLFKKWMNKISMLRNVQIPRYVEVNDSTEMHVFVDACKEAYAACIYFRTETPLGVKIQLSRAKTRVAPLKQLSIPRLELMSISIGARLAHSVKQALNIQTRRVVFWSDSMVALYWLRECGDWSVFVSNRIKEIKSLFPNGEWRHVPGKMNPADLLSRGCSPSRLVESKWWEGPSWLVQTSDNWPVNELMNSEMSKISSERRKTKVCNLNLSEQNVPWYARKFSKFHSIIRLVSWVLRFVKNARSNYDERKKGKLTLEEIENAESLLIRLIQAQNFPDENSIPNLCVFKDENGVIRVKTRITERIDKPTFLSPILLPGNCSFTRRLIEHFHLDNCHAGTQILLSVIREKYWILKGRKSIRNVIKDCVKCHRYTAKPLMADPAPLPTDRVENAAVFEVVGIDLAGPLFVKKGNKVWVVLFTCALYRAVHLELVSSLSTDTFLLSLRRFIARRGRPRVIYSDNGTNFRGAYNDFQQIDWQKINQYTEIQRITWKFLPPTAAWWGGWWERLVRIIKELLRRSLGKAILSHEELETVICDCERIINSRPLTYLSEDMQDLSPLTPSMFLLDRPGSDVADVDMIDANHLRKRIRFRYKLLEHLRMRFRKEYLGQLIQKHQNSKSSSIQLGDIVLVGDDFKKRIHWPLAKVIELIPGRDNQVRTVKLKTQSNELIRPIQRIFPLEVQSSDFPVQRVIEGSSPTSASQQPPTLGGPSDSSPTLKSRYGRVIKRPVKLNL